MATTRSKYTREHLAVLLMFDVMRDIGAGDNNLTYAENRDWVLSEIESVVKARQLNVYIDRWYEAFGRKNF